MNGLDLQYLQMPIPQGTGSQRMLKANWSGLNYRQVHDTGALSFESNISTCETPYLTPSQKRAVYKSGYANPICMYGFDDFLVIIYNSGGAKIDYITAAGTVYTGDLKNTLNDMRSIVKFNVYDTPTDPIGGKFVQKLLIFPDKKSMDFKISANFTPADLSVGINQMPDIKYAAVHLSRVFGVDDDRIYASGFNDYSNWNLNTIDDFDNPSNAWASPAQANTKANGKFTAITAFQNHIVCFKKDFMHELYNNKNPFRIQDIFSEGTIDNRSIQDVDGRLIFVGVDGVKVYTGGNPRLIGYNLGVGRFDKAVSGTDNRRYYLYCERTSKNDDGTDKKTHNLFVFDTLIDQWAEESIDSEVLSFAHNSTGMYMLCADGKIYKLDTGDFSQNWSFETDFTMAQTVDIKHIRKVQMYAEIANGSSLDAYILYDDEKFNSAASHKIFTYNNTSGASQKVPIRVIPRQTANYAFKLRVNGYGYSRLYNLEWFVKQGGELFV